VSLDDGAELARGLVARLRVYRSSKESTAVIERHATFPPTVGTAPDVALAVAALAAHVIVPPVCVGPQRWEPPSSLPAAGSPRLPDRVRRVPARCSVGSSIYAKTLDQGIERGNRNAAQPSKLDRLKRAGADELVHERTATSESIRNLTYGEQHCARPNRALVRSAHGRHRPQPYIGVLTARRFIKDQL
jgi:hypothetical protein